MRINVRIIVYFKEENNMLFSDFNKSSSSSYDDDVAQSISVRKRDTDARSFNDYRASRGVRSDRSYSASASISQNKAKTELANNIIGKVHSVDGSGIDVEGSDILNEILLRVMKIDPYAAALLCTLAVAQDSNIRKITVDNDRFVYNPEYVKNTPIEKCTREILSALIDVAQLGTKGGSFVVLDMGDYR